MLRRQALIHGVGFLGGATLGALPGIGRAQSIAGLTPRKIVLGQSAAFSGYSDQLGLQYYLGAKLYFDDLNARGGVNGRTIEISKLDDADVVSRCVGNTRRLIQDGVFGLFGYVGTLTSQAALPLASAERMPFFAPSTGDDALRKPFNRYAFHLRASYADEVDAIVKQLGAIGAQRIAVFFQNDEHGKSVVASLEQALKAAKLPPVATAAVERNSTDVEEAVKTILAGEPGAILQVGSYRASAAFVRRARSQGYAGKFYNLSLVGTQALLDELGTVARGVVVSQVMPYPYKSTVPIAAEYLKALTGKRGIAPNYSGMEGFVAAKAFAEGVKRAGSNLSREGFVDAMASMQKFDMGGFLLDFGANQHVGSHFVELTLLSEDGKVRH